MNTFLYEYIQQWIAGKTIIYRIRNRKKMIRIRKDEYKSVISW
jgi:hypothetical protein